jgi:putative nucleotidyltransferase with HDIG domain
LFKSLETRRFETMQHSQRVAAYCRLIAINFGLPGKQLSELEVGALLHDIGKVAVPQNVIEKPGRLTDDEWRVMKLHPAIGARLLSEIPDCSAESNIVLCHHERFDGGGYPNGLRGQDIPLGARIFAVADTLDAICSLRPYRKASPLSVARKEIDAMAGSQFDPAVVRSFRMVTDSEILAIQKIYAESEAPLTFRHPSNSLLPPFPAFHPSR